MGRFTLTVSGAARPSEPHRIDEGQHATVHRAKTQPATLASAARNVYCTCSDLWRRSQGTFSLVDMRT